MCINVWVMALLETFDASPRQGLSSIWKIWMHVSYLGRAEAADKIGAHIMFPIFPGADRVRMRESREGERRRNGPNG